MRVAPERVDRRINPGVERLAVESPSGGGGTTLAEYIVTITEGRWLIAASILVAVLAAIAYIVLAPPRYRADILVQVEDKASGAGALQDVSALFGDKTPADTEIEVIRSRYLVGAVVNQLSLDVVAGPRTFPLIGSVLQRSYDDEGFRSPVLGLDRFAWGGERIRVTRLSVPEPLIGKPLTIVARGGNQFELRGPDGQSLLQGQVGTHASGSSGMVGRRSVEPDAVEIFVAELAGRPGTEFRATRLRRSDVVEYLQKQLQIGEKGKKTGIIQASLEGEDPARIAAILDAVATTYLRQNVERKSAEAQKTLEFLETQLPALKANVDAAELAMEKYQRAHGSVDVSLETQAAIDRAVDLEKRITELQVETAALRERFTETHPALAQMKQKMARLQAEKGNVEARLKDLPGAELDAARLTRDVQLATQLYVLLLNKAQELRVVKEGTIGNVRILDTAVTPHRPVAPRKGLALVAAAVLGIGVGVGMAFARRALARGVEDPNIVERETGIGVFAVVPHSEREQQLGNVAARRKAPAALLASVDDHDVAIEALRSLRTSLQFALATAPNNVVTILGPAPVVGKSFIAANLASALTETGKRVLLVDGDLRKGRLHRFFGQKREGGLSEAISGAAPVAGMIRPTGLRTLDFLATGRTPPNASALLGSDSFSEVIEELSRSYDFVVVDTPPILAVTDAALIGRLAGVNLLVVRAGKHPTREIIAAVKAFEQSGAHVHGAVMNDVRSGIGYRRYHYYYSYDQEDADDQA